MTERNKDIEQAAHDRYPHETWIFIDGAKWADSNPGEETIKRIITIYKRWYSEQSDTSMVEYIKRNWNNEDRIIQ